MKAVTARIGLYYVFKGHNVVCGLNNLIKTEVYLDVYKRQREDYYDYAGYCAIFADRFYIRRNVYKHTGAKRKRTADSKVNGQRIAYRPKPLPVAPLHIALDADAQKKMNDAEQKAPQHGGHQLSLIHI